MLFLRNLAAIRGADVCAHVVVCDRFRDFIHDGRAPSAYFPRGWRGFAGFCFGFGSRKVFVLVVGGFILAG